VDCRLIFIKFGVCFAKIHRLEHGLLVDSYKIRWLFLVDRRSIIKKAEDSFAKNARHMHGLRFDFYKIWGVFCKNPQASTWTTG
jgi:hypothetical protein